jgi:hypothetical protein
MESRQQSYSGGVIKHFPKKAKMTSQIAINGKIRHKRMTQDEILRRIRLGFPNTKLGERDFVLYLNSSRVSFYCAGTGNLEFSITPVNPVGQSALVSERTVTSTEILIRAADELWPNLRRDLTAGIFKRRPELNMCNLEDPESLGVLLKRDRSSPLRSPGAKLAWVLSAFFLILALALTIWQLTSYKPSGARTSNILTILTSLSVAAITVPAPILLNWFDWKKASVWKYRGM